MEFASDGIDYRLGYNPEFERRASAINTRRARERKAAEAKALRQEQEEARRAVDRVVSQYRAIAVVGGKTPVREIIAKAAVEFGIPVEAILGSSRSYLVVEARHTAMWRARKERPDLSFPQLGDIFRRDHTTIIHACQKMDQREREGAA